MLAFYEAQILLPHVKWCYYNIQDILEHISLTGHAIYCYEVAGQHIITINQPLTHRRATPHSTFSTAIAMVSALRL